MRIDSTDVDENGNAILTSQYAGSVVCAESANGPFGANEAGYAQYRADGTASTGATASWAPLGSFPSDVILAADLLGGISIAYPNSASPIQLTRWGRWDALAQPSTDFGVTAEEGVRFSWFADSGLRKVRGLFGSVVAGSTIVQPRMAVDSGAVWWVAPGAVTCLDFATDLAVLYQETAGRFWAGGLVNPETPDEPYGEPDSTFAVPVYPYRAIATYREQFVAWVAIGGGASVVLLRKDFRNGGEPFTPVETFELVSDGEYLLPTALRFEADGRLLVLGRSGTSPTSSGVGRLGWAARASVRSGNTWSGPAFGPAAVTGTTVTTAHDGTASWAAIGRYVFKFPVVAAGAWTASALSPLLWAGPRALPLDADVLQRTIDTCEGIVDIAFDKGMPALLLQLTATQNSGSLLCLYDRGMANVLYRRRYRADKGRFGLVNVPFRYPDSPVIQPGRTLVPPPGYGPDDLVA